MNADLPVVDPFMVAKDPQMPFLRMALDPAAAQNQLRHCYARAGLPGKLQLTAIAVLRYKRERRCLIAYEVHVAGRGQFTLIGKARAKGADKRTFELMRQLRDEGFGEAGKQGVSVPEPVGLIPEFGMWLQVKVRGTPAQQLLPGSHGVELARRIGIGLHALHQANIPVNREHLVADELRILCERLDQVAQQQPGWSSRLQQVIARCEQVGKALIPSERRGIHRDFYPAQVLVDDERLWFVDFDLFCLGDPALDAGNFLAHVAEQSLREFKNPAAMQAQETAFEEAFLRAHGEQLRPNVQAYRLMSLARHIWISTQSPERQHSTERLLQLCEERS